MARLHSKKKGKSGTKRAKRKEPHDWGNVSVDEVKEIVRGLAKKGVPSARIGIILRDLYGVPSFKALTGKRIVEFLREEKLYSFKLPEDMINLLRKAVRMWNHLKTNKKDVHNKVKYQHILSKIHRLARYYKEKGIVPKDWKYSPDTAALIVR